MSKFNKIKGWFVVEGVDNSGKTSTIESIKSEKREGELCTGLQWGDGWKDFSERISKDPACFTSSGYFQATAEWNIDFFNKTIKPHLDSGGVCIQDRNLLTSRILVGTMLAYDNDDMGEAKNYAFSKTVIGLMAGGVEITPQTPNWTENQAEDYVFFSYMQKYFGGVPEKWIVFVSEDVDILKGRWDHNVAKSGSKEVVDEKSGTFFNFDDRMFNYDEVAFRNLKYSNFVKRNPDFCMKLCTDDFAGDPQLAVSAVKKIVASR